MCREIDQEFLELAQRFNLKDGSTLLMGLLHDGKVSLANVGDSCAFLLKQNGEMRKITTDQNADREDEQNRIINKNGLITCRDGVSRVDGQIIVSRAIGDMPYKEFIISEPECHHSNIQEDDDILVLCSDGLLLVYSEE